MPGITTTYIRHQIPTPLDPQRRFGPKPADGVHGHECLACGKEFEEGDFTTLIPLGPGDDPEDQEKAQAGRWYNAVCVEIHWACAGGRPDV